ncbi:MAG: ABC transporter permease [Cytophagales bacterium]|tara:strand:+ start:912 stop:2135 length:1224 start_codon:yes stop_codon:yes gene_type:complete
MIFKIAWRNIYRNKKRSLITITSVFAALLLIILMRALQFGFYDKLIETVVESYAGYVEIHADGFWDNQSLDNSMQVDQQLLDDIQSVEGVENIVQRLQTFSLISVGEKTKGGVINGINLSEEQKITDWNKKMVSGSFDLSDNEIIIAKGIAEFFDISENDTLILYGQGYRGMMAAGKYPVKGIIDLKNPDLNKIGLFMTMESVRNYVSSDEISTHIIIGKEKYYDEGKIVEDLGLILSDDYEVMTWKETLPEIEQTITADSAGGLIMAFILYVIVVFGMFGTVLMMTEERKYEFGVLISIGMSRIRLFGIILVETIILSMVGVVLAVMVTYPISIYYNINPIDMAILMGDGAVQMIEEMGFSPMIPMSISWDIPLSHSLVIFIFSLLISIYPAIKISKLNPVKSMKV